MKHERYWMALMKRWKLLFASIVVVGLGAFFGSYFVTPLYQSSVLVQVAVSVNNNRADSNSLIASSDLAQTESVLAVSQSILHEVASHYKDVSTEQLAKEVRSSVKASTELFEVDVTDSSPERAAALANDIATVLIQQQVQHTQQNNSRALLPIRQEIATTEATINVLTAQLASLQGKSGVQEQIATLQGERDRLQQHENQWQMLLAQLQQVQAQSGSFLNIAQPATPDSTPVQPQILSYTYKGLLSGFLLGLLLVMLLERFDTRIRTADAIHQQLNGSLPVLATIWKEREATVNPPVDSPNSESYQSLCTNLDFLALYGPLQTLLVTSSTAHEGKSTVAANLAICAARAGKKTVLIDANLHHPAQYKNFQLPGEKLGLSNALLAYVQQVMDPQLSFQGQSVSLPLEKYLHPVAMPNLWVMPSGPLPPHPSKLLASKALDLLLERIIGSGIEIIIIDTVPLLNQPDADILSTKVHGTIVVIDITGTHKGSLQVIQERMANIEANILGYVVNKKRRKRKDGAHVSHQNEEQLTSREYIRRASNTALSTSSHNQEQAVPTKISSLSEQKTQEQPSYQSRKEV